MKWQEFVLDKLNETKLFEMAHERKDAKDTVTNLSPQIMLHLVKIFVFESPENVNHWASEINNWLNIIDDIYLKQNKKKLSHYDLYNWIILDSAPHYAKEYLDRNVRKMKRTDYASLPLRQYDSEEVMNKIISIIDSVCIDMSNDEFVTIRDYL